MEMSTGTMGAVMVAGEEVVEEAVDFVGVEEDVSVVEICPKKLAFIMTMVEELLKAVVNFYLLLS